MAAVPYFADLAGAMQSTAAIQQEILTEVAVILSLPVPNTTAAYPYSQYQQDAFPYWVTQNVLVQSEMSGTDLDLEIYNLLMRLHLGKATEGYLGEMETQLFTYIPYTLAKFRARPLLQSAAFPTPVNDLNECFVVLTNGLIPKLDTIACEFRITLPFNITVHEDY